MPQDDKSALVVLVPGAEPIVGEFRMQFDISGISGLPPHVTILSPFAPPKSLGRTLLANLRAFFAREPLFDFSLVGLCGFPTVLYLAPEPLGSFDSLTNATAARFPDYPPYRGAFASPVPHLTVAQRPPADDLVSVCQSVLEIAATYLPLSCCAREVALAVKHGGRWSVEDHFPLALEPAA
jgi:hypothetical protein